MKRTVITLFLTLLSFSAIAEFKPHDISRFEPTVPGDKPVVFKSTDQPVVAVQNDVKVTLETVPYANKSINIQRLTFYVGDEITARYPLYGY